MNRLVIMIVTCWALALPCQAEGLKSASFSGQVVSELTGHEANIKIISLSPNDFKLLPRELIRVNFYPSQTESDLKPGALISGNLFYRQAEVNQELVDWYMVKDYQVSPPPRLSDRARSLLAMFLGLVAVGSALAAEKISQKQKKLL